jgi:hypothetical protein
VFSLDPASDDPGLVSCGILRSVRNGEELRERAGQEKDSQDNVILSDIDDGWQLRSDDLVPHAGVSIRSTRTTPGPSGLRVSKTRPLSPVPPAAPAQAIVMPSPRFNSHQIQPIVKTARPGTRASRVCLCAGASLGLFDVVAVGPVDRPIVQAKTDGYFLSATRPIGSH